MIIKSLSRQNKSFRELYNYLVKDKEAILGAFNLYSNPKDKKAVVKEFLDNAKFLKKSRGKNFLYHEILSLNPNSLDLKKQIAILNDLVNRYVNLRAKDHLVFTAIHKDKKHLHIHLMISANELYSSKRVRFSKKDFNKIQKELENYLLNNYPELNSKKIYTKESKEKKSNKEKLKNILDSIFKNISSIDEFYKALETNNLELYTRGKTVGIVFEGKKYRLKTLGFIDEYERVLNSAKNSKQEIEKRREEMKKIREDKENKTIEKEIWNIIKNFKIKRYINKAPKKSIYDKMVEKKAKRKEEKKLSRAKRQENRLKDREWIEARRAKRLTEYKKELKRRRKAKEQNRQR